MKSIATEIKVADEVWLIVAMLHREQSTRADFTIDEVMERAERDALTGKLRPGVYAHVIQHCVANRAPNSGRYRMLFETGPGRRRLFRTGDPYHPDREGGKTVPVSDELPRHYQTLLDWYQQWDLSVSRRRIEEDPILALVGSGKHLWDDEDPD